MLLGTVAVCMLFLLLVGSGFRIAIQADRPFSKLFASGLTTIIGVQTFVIVGGVIRVIPLTGVTLPFVSYGGSSLIANFVIIALLLRISDATVARALDTLAGVGSAEERLAALLQLVADRAGAERAAVVADIVRRLDGAPLAIELAAAQLDVMDVETLAERLRAAGYRTAGIGLNAHLERAFRLDQGFDDYRFPARLDYGIALGASQLNATANVAGTFSYSPAAGAVLNAGSHPLSVTFTPDDAANYDVASANVALTVARAASAISWCATSLAVGSRSRSATSSRS